MFASAAASVQRKRRRPALACDRCRRRKIKCDRKLPCSHCVRTGFGPSCTYVTSDQIGATVVREPDESIQDSSSNSQYTGYGDCNISPTFSIGSTSAENELHENFWDLYALPTGDTCSQGPVSSVIDYPDSSIGAQALQQRVRQLEQKLASVSKAEASKNDQASAASQDNERVKGRMWQRSLLGRSHWSSSVINVRLDPLPRAFPVAERLIVKYSSTQINPYLKLSSKRRAQRSIFPFKNVNICHGRSDITTIKRKFRYLPIQETISQLGKLVMLLSGCTCGNSNVSSGSCTCQHLNVIMKNFGMIPDPLIKPT